MNKLEGLKKGDRVKITRELAFCHIDLDGDLWMKTEDGRSELFLAHGIAAPSFTIEKLPDPIKVGDRVRDTLDGDEGVVVGLDDGQAWVRLGGQDYRFESPVKRLERIDQ